MLILFCFYTVSKQQWKGIIFLNLEPQLNETLKRFSVVAKQILKKLLFHIYVVLKVFSKLIFIGE